MEWFKGKAREIERNELESFRAELSDRNEQYAKEVRDSGFETTHEYEQSLLFPASIIIIAVLLAIAWVVCILLFKTIVANIYFGVLITSSVLLIFLSIKEIIRIKS